MAELKHLGIIMDGNRRWAKEHLLPSFEGHRRGYDKTKEIGDLCLAKGIKTLTLYAFSTENWTRAVDEVNYLMDLLYKVVTSEIPTYNKKGIRLKIIGSREKLSEKLIKAIEQAEEETKNNDKGTLNLAINYGGRLEIVEAIKKAVKSGVNIENLTEEDISKNLWTAGQNDPDLIIRTSGEQRLSGFLTWQSVYSELYFIKKHWPEFSEEDLDGAIDEFNKRCRRFGGN